MSPDEKAREIAKGLCASMPCDRHLWCDCPSRVTGSTLAKDKANEGVAHCLENLDEIATALLEARREGIEEAAKVADAHADVYEAPSTDIDKGHEWAAQDIAAAIRALA